MTEPERIWAVPERNCTVYMSGNSPITAQDGPFIHRLHGAASEYIRADLVEALEAENQRLREALREIEELNLTTMDENGHRWENSDLIGQEVRAALHNTEASHD